MTPTHADRNGTPGSRSGSQSTLASEDRGTTPRDPGAEGSGAPAGGEDVWPRELKLSELVWKREEIAGDGEYRCRLIEDQIIHNIWKVPEGYNINSYSWEKEFTRVFKTRVTSINDFELACWLHGKLLCPKDLELWERAKRECVYPIKE